MKLPSTVKTNREYTIEEVFETIKRETELPVSHIQRGIGSGISVPSEGKHPAYVLVRKDEITLTGLHGKTHARFLRECTRLFGVNEWTTESEEFFDAAEKIVAEHDKDSLSSCCCGVGFLGFCGALVFAILLIWWITEMYFAHNVLPDWEESTATIHDVWVESETITFDWLHALNEDNIVNRYNYKVSTGFRISFPITDGVAEFHDFSIKDGTTHENTIPKSAYQFDYAPGDTPVICYDPKNPKKYRFGEREKLEQLGDPTGLFVFGIPLLLFLIPTIFVFVRYVRFEKKYSRALHALPGSEKYLKS